MPMPSMMTHMSPQPTVSIDGPFGGVGWGYRRGRGDIGLSCGQKLAQRPRVGRARHAEPGCEGKDNNCTTRPPRIRQDAPHAHTPGRLNGTGRGAETHPGKPALVPLPAAGNVGRRSRMRLAMTYSLTAYSTTSALRPKEFLPGMGPSAVRSMAKKNSVRQSVATMPPDERPNPAQAAT